MAEIKLTISSVWATCIIMEYKQKGVFFNIPGVHQLIDHRII